MHLPTLSHRLAPDSGRVTAHRQRRQDGRPPRSSQESEIRQHKDSTRQDQRTSGRKRAGARQQGGSRETEKRYDIYLRERREKNTAETRKGMQVCVYILLNIVACWLFIALSFIYIRGILYIFIYILSRLMFTFLLKLMVLRYFIIIWIVYVYFTIRICGFCVS